MNRIKEVLKENDLTPQDISAIGTNDGPGSFTGIRACTTVARMMAQQLNIPACGVSSLEILAKINKTEKPTIVALDARKNKAYIYDGDIKGAIELEQVDELVKGRTLITDNSLLERFSQFTDKAVSYQVSDYPLGEILAKLAYEKAVNNEEIDWRKLKPLYIQPPPVFGK